MGNTLTMYTLLTIYTLLDRLLLSGMCNCCNGLCSGPWGIVGGEVYRCGR
jgi:hypothetical protein